MTKRLEVYKCEICGNIIEMMHGGAGALSCCGKEMVLQVENTRDAAVEKHLPKVTKLSDGYEVQIGSTLHPMTEDHYIEWIELIVDGCVSTKFLKPGDIPKITFKACYGEHAEARAYCNLHGHWKTNK